MNYAKVIGSALQLFPKKITITLLEPHTNRLLGKYKVPADSLPTAFDRPTTLTLNNIQWRVLTASPVSADDFLYSRKLQLHVQPVTQASPDRYYWPTRCDWTPEMVAVAGGGPESRLPHMPPLPDESNAPTADGSALTIDRRDWLQWQFLSVQHREQVEEALEQIRSILKSQTNPLLGYDQQYLRTGIRALDLAIGWDELVQLLEQPAALTITLETGEVIKDAFGLQTDSHTYYGRMQEGKVTSMGLSGLDYVDEELMRVMATFGIELIDWCRVSRLSAEAGEPPKSEAINW